MSDPSRDVCEYKAIIFPYRHNVIPLFLIPPPLAVLYPRKRERVVLTFHEAPVELWVAGGPVEAVQTAAGVAASGPSVPGVKHTLKRRIVTKSSLLSRMRFCVYQTNPKKMLFRSFNQSTLYLAGFPVTFVTAHELLDDAFLLLLSSVTFVTLVNVQLGNIDVK